MLVDHDGVPWELFAYLWHNNYVVDGPISRLAL